MAKNRECDVLVVGGGPAGSTIAALLAQKNRHVVVLEKERFPRFHIGESLLPLNLPLFDRLGIADEVHRIGVYKPGAELISDEHNAATTFRFADNPYLSVGHSYQVRRSEFDKLLLDNSRRLGAEVIEGARVAGVSLDNGKGPSVNALDEDGAATEWSARFLVDASGRDTLLTSKLGLKRINKQNNTAAVFGHFRDVPRRPGDKEGMITVYLFEHGWFWIIPLPGDVMSVGVVGTQVLFSSGVMMAMSSAAFGATVVEGLLEGRVPRQRLVRDYERKIRHSLNSLSWLIYRINSPLLRDIFMSSFDLFNTRHELITILAGDFYERRSWLSPLRRLQLAYGCLLVLSKFGFRLGHANFAARG